MRVLVPGERRVGVAGLDDVLLPEQVRVLAQRRLADLGHRVAEQELPELGLVLVDHVAEVALAARVDADPVDAGDDPHPPHLTRQITKP
jgi:hypothetical protein